MSDSNPSSFADSRDQAVRIFVSYAREDARWFDPNYHFNLVPFITESLRRSNVIVWYDKGIIAGDEFTPLIMSEIDRAHIAVLIVSQPFLNSRFIETHEMPRMAERAQRGELVVVPVLVEPCDWHDYPFLAARQMVPSSSPLIHYTESEPKWVDVRFQILDGLKTQVKRVREGMQAEALRRETEARIKREKELEERRKLDDQRKREDAERLAREQAERVAREDTLKEAYEEAERKAREDAARKARERADHDAANDEALRREAEERQKREQELEAQRQREAAGRNAREQSAQKSREAAEREAAEREGAQAESLRREAEERKKREQELEEQRQKEETARKARDLADQKAREETERIAHESAARKAQEDAARNAREEAERRDRGKKKDRGLDPGIVLRIFKIFFVLCALACVALVVDAAYHHWFGYAGTKWTALTSGANGSLAVVAGSSDGKILYACGESGLFLSSTDGGASWVNRSTGSLLGCHSLFSTPDGKHIWAATMTSQLHASSDGGASWESAYLPVPANTPGTLSSSLSDQVLHSTPRVVETSPGMYTIEPGSLVKEGSLFADTNPSPATSVPHHVDAIFGTPDGVHLWAVGNFGDIYQSNGAGWDSRVSNTSADLLAISGTSDGNVLMAVGNVGVTVESIDAGQGWWHYDTPSKFALRSVFVSSNAKILCAVGDVSSVFISTDKGVTWTEGQKNAAGSFRGVFGTPDGKHLWAVGTSGIIIQSDDSGVTWTLRQSGTKADLSAIFGTSDGKHLYVAGDSGTILESKTSIF